MIHQLPTSTLFPYTTLFRSARLADVRAAEDRDTNRVLADLGPAAAGQALRSEEHTSELQSQFHLVCRLLLEKKNLLSCRLFADDPVEFCGSHNRRTANWRRDLMHLGVNRNDALGSPCDDAAPSIKCTEIVFF